MSFDIGVGDLTPLPITIQTNGEIVVVDIAADVQLRWQKPDGSVEMVTLTNVNRALGQFRRDFVAGDTDQVGTHYAHVIVTEGGIPKTYPSDGSRIIWFVNPA